MSIFKKPLKVTFANKTANPVFTPLRIANQKKKEDKVTTQMANSAKLALLSALWCALIILIDSHPQLCSRSGPIHTGRGMRPAMWRKQMGPIDVNGGVHTAHKQHQRKNVRICTRVVSRALCGLGLWLRWNSRPQLCSSFGYSENTHGITHLRSGCHNSQKTTTQEKHNVFSHGTSPITKLNQTHVPFSHHCCYLAIRLRSLSSVPRLRPPPQKKAWTAPLPYWILGGRGLPGP